MGLEPLYRGTKGSSGVAKRAAKPVTKAHKTEPAKADAKEQVNEAIAKARASSHEMLLLGLGAVAKARKAREERRSDLIAEGKRFEPKFKQAIDMKTSRPTCNRRTAPSSTCPSSISAARSSTALPSKRA